MNWHPALIVCAVLAAAALLWLVTLLTIAIVGDALVGGLIDYLFQDAPPA
jgi:hypothetical protein